MNLLCPAGSVALRRPRAVVAGGLAVLLLALGLGSAPPAAFAEEGEIRVSLSQRDGTPDFDSADGPGLTAAPATG